MSLEIIRASSKVKPEIKDDIITIRVNIKMEGNIGEQLSNVDLTKPDTFKELENSQAVVIKEEINAALEKAQKEWGTDVFQFGEAVHSKYPKQWKNLEDKLDEEFKNINVEIKVESNLRRVGMSTKPIMGDYRR